MQQIAPITAKFPSLHQMSTGAPAPAACSEVNTGVIRLASFGRNTPSRHVYAKNADREAF